MKTKNLFFYLFLSLIWGLPALGNGNGPVEDVEDRPVVKAAKVLRQIQKMNFGEFKLNRLSGGLTNHIFLVEAPTHGKLVLRMAGEEADSLGINNHHQAAHTIMAGELGVSPKVVYTSDDKKIMLINFFQGTGLTPDTVTPEILQELFFHLKKVHQGPSFLSEFNPYQTLKKYRTMAIHNQVVFPSEEAEAMEVLAKIEEIIGPHSSEFTGACHNDLHTGNILVKVPGPGLSIIDWDYSGNNDIFYDLAIFSNSLNLDEGKARDLLKIYFQGSPEEKNLEKHLAHLQVMRMVSDLWNAFWYFSQIGVSKIPFEHEKFAHKSLELFLDKARLARFNQWINSLSQNPNQNH